MLIGTKKDDRRLEKLHIENGAELMKASDLLYELLNASYMCSGTCLEMDINGHRENVQSLYWNCKELMEQTLKGGKKTAFLSMSVLEDTFKKAYPLLLVNIKDIVEGNDSQICVAQKLIRIFKENPYAKLWEEKAETYRNLIESLGFQVKTTDYTVLTAIMEPLLDAFTLYGGRPHRSAPVIHKVRSGHLSKKRPEIAVHVWKFHSEKEFVDSIAECGKESVIAFGAVEKTNRQLSDGWTEWYYGYPDERERNYIKNLGITKEEYLESIADYSRSIYLCVKSAETIWLMKMPYLMDGYTHLDNPDTKYYYGNRAGYAPYQIFYKDLPAAEVNTTFLSVPKKGYLLSELMDDEQKVWLPVFLEETYEKFFLSEPESEPWVLPEEIEAVIPADAGAAADMKIVPVISNVPCVSTYSYKIPSPKELFNDEPHMNVLCDYFHITPKDILSAPVLPVRCQTSKKMDHDIQGKIEAAYRKVLAEKIADFLEDRWSVRLMCLHYISKHEDEIVDRAGKGFFADFSSELIDGVMKLDKEGNPVMVSKTSWSYEKVPDIVRTTTEDCREYNPSTLRGTTYHKTIWVGPKSSGKASVVYKIRPKTARDYAILLNIPEHELPETLRLADSLDWFYRRYNHSLPRNLTYQCTANSDLSRIGKKSIYLIPFADINLCMQKRTYKKWMMEMKDEE